MLALALTISPISKGSVAANGEKTRECHRENRTELQANLDLISNDVLSKREIKKTKVKKTISEAIVLATTAALVVSAAGVVRVFNWLAKRTGGWRRLHCHSSPAFEHFCSESGLVGFKCVPINAAVVVRRYAERAGESKRR